MLPLSVQLYIATLFCSSYYDVILCVYNWTDNRKILLLVLYNKKKNPELN
jgi:hypothetical protein